MSILKAEILSQVNSETARAETNIDDIIRDVLTDLSLDIDTPVKHAYCRTEVGTAIYDLSSYPEIFKKVDCVKINTGEPLKKIESLEQYQALIADETTADYDEPDSYFIHNNAVYLYPTPDAIYNLNMFATTVEADENDIDVDDVCKPAIVQGCIYRLYASKGLGANTFAQTHLQLYMQWKEKLVSFFSNRTRNGQAKYNDI